MGKKTNIIFFPYMNEYQHVRRETLAQSAYLVQPLLSRHAAQIVDVIEGKLEAKKLRESGERLATVISPIVTWDRETKMKAVDVDYRKVAMRVMTQLVDAEIELIRNPNAKLFLAIS